MVEEVVVEGSGEVGDEDFDGGLWRAVKFREFAGRFRVVCNEEEGK